jgi:glycosyltransferase involved in cell wall biosynthesis
MVLQARPTMLWLAYGLNDEMTGVERVIVELARELQELGWLERVDLEVVVDRDASWPEALEPSVRVRRVTRPRFGVAGAPRMATTRFVGLHSFGATIPRRRPPFSLYTVHDWGPLRDARLPARARAAWSLAMLTGILRATNVHFYSAGTLAAAPWFLRGWLRHRAIVSSPRVAAPSRPSQYATEGHMLFVGTDSARKRLDVVVAAARQCEWAPVLICVGTGTQRVHHPPKVLGLGRIGQQELDQLYETAAAVVLVSDYEGFGLPVAEAAVRGLATIVSSAVAAAQPPELQRFLRIVPDVTADSLSAEFVSVRAAPGRLPRLAQRGGSPLAQLYLSRWSARPSFE